ncbi:hypothetical protein [Curtobacterium sp. ISL-83]|uniref:hypothetical protein n=1 Tax=Curtobacterium sp. ISL-83 TaxID=2819145 RepID=UPI001BE5A86F|nr:hypothetical protein [Curtobacterium sp. ISL-83]MBT2503491.1 hypothetical protein [Curtobacterium sp. ISL-83]
MSDVSPSPELRALVQAADLVGISYFELSALRDEGASTTPEGLTELQLSQEMGYGFREDDAAFRVRVRTTVKAPGQGEIVVGLNGEWSYGGGSAKGIEQSTLLDFINNVAMMVLLPYLREATADLSRRVFGSALLLPLIQRGDIEFTSEHLNPGEAV